MTHSSFVLIIVLFCQINAERPVDEVFADVETILKALA